MISFQGKRFLITGAAAGIARAAAEMLVRHGARLALCDVNVPALEQLESALQVLVPEADILVLGTDVANAQACNTAAASAAQHFGQIDHLIHSAGIYPERRVADMRDDEWRTVMRINLDGTFNMCRAVIPYLADDSAIVLLASVAGQKGSLGHAHYAASKGAVISFARSLALELAPRTRVNAVSPGIIATAMTKDLLSTSGPALLHNTPLQRLGTAEDVAGTIAFLCSPLAAFITGETVQVNGGLYIN